MSHTTRISFAAFVLGLALSVPCSMAQTLDQLVSLASTSFEKKYEKSVGNEWAGAYFKALVKGTAGSAAEVASVRAESTATVKYLKKSKVLFQGHALSPLSGNKELFLSFLGSTKINWKNPLSYSKSYSQTLDVVNSTYNWYIVDVTMKLRLQFSLDARVGNATATAAQAIFNANATVTGSLSAKASSWADFFGFYARVHAQDLDILGAHMAARAVAGRDDLGRFDYGGKFVITMDPVNIYIKVEGGASWWDNKTWIPFEPITWGGLTKTLLDDPFYIMMLQMVR